MKNIIKLLGVITLAVVIGFSMAACDGGGGGNGDRDDKGSVSGNLPAAKGKLTVTDIPSEHNGKWIYSVWGMAPGGYLYGIADVTGSHGDFEYTYVEIKDGKAELPLYQLGFSSGKFTAYDGNDSFSSDMMSWIVIFIESVPKGKAQGYSGSDTIGSMSVNSGTFTNGNMTVQWQSSGN